MKDICECSSYEKCEAPLCPLSEELDSCVWYPDEQVCMARKFTSLHWVRIQKRLRKYKVKGDAGYFTKQMLEDTRRCTKTTKGIDPDSRKARQVEDTGDSPKETPIPLSKAVKGYLKHKLGYPNDGRGIKEGQLVLIQ